MKRLILSISLIIAVLAAASCSRPSATVKHIPDDAFMAVKINPGTLVKQSGITDNSELRTLLSASMSKKDFKIVEAILEDPSSTGIRLDDYMVLTSTSRCTVLLIPVADAGDFAAFLEKTEVEIYPGSKDILYYIGDDDQDDVDGIIKKDLAVILVDDGSMSASALDYITKNENTIDGEAYKRFASTSEALAFWLDGEELSSLAYERLGSGFGEISGMLSGSALYGSVEPGKGGIDFYLKPYVDKKALKRAGYDYDVDDFFAKGSDKYFKYMPSDPVLVFNGATRDFGHIVDVLPSELTSDLDYICEEFGISRRKLEDVGGKMTAGLSINGFELDYWGEPDFTPTLAFAIECDEDIFESLASAYLPDYGDAYFVGDDDFGLYLFAADGAVIGMTEDLYGRSRGSALPDNLSKKDFRKKVSSTGLTVNLSAPAIKDIFEEVFNKEGLPPSLTKELLRSLGLLDYASVELDLSDESLRGTIRSTEKNEYFLATLLDCVLGAAKKAALTDF